jgi:hypothetical protein
MPWCVSCLCVCMYVCMYVFHRFWVCTNYVILCVCNTFIYIYVCMYVCMYVYVYVYVYTYIQTHVHVCMYRPVSYHWTIATYIHARVFVCMYIHIHIYIYIYIYRNRCSPWFFVMIVVLAGMHIWIRSHKSNNGVLCIYIHTPYNIYMMYSRVHSHQHKCACIVYTYTRPTTYIHDVYTCVFTLAYSQDAQIHNTERCISSNLWWDIHTHNTSINTRACIKSTHIHMYACMYACDTIRIDAMVRYTATHVHFFTTRTSRHDRLMNACIHNRSTNACIHNR